MSQTNENTESAVTPEALLGKINESTEALQDAQQTVVDAVGKVTNAIDEHNVDVEAHPNIRGNIDEITETAQTAQTAASEASEKADNALAAANAVNDIATAAQTAASEASDKATAAQTAASEASDKAAAAQTAASEASDKAAAAQTTAAAAQTAASEARTMADSALEKAEEALAKPGGGDVSEIVERVEALENKDYGTNDTFTSGGTEEASGFILADGTDLADIFLSTEDVSLETSGTGAILTGLSLDKSVKGKAAFTQTKGAITYCSYCTHCTASHCTYCQHCSYCNYCTYCNCSSNCGDN